MTVGRPVFYVVREVSHLVCGIFYAALSNYNKSKMTDELERIWKKATVAWLITIPKFATLNKRNHDGP
jgi:hypothetical protein